MSHSSQEKMGDYNANDKKEYRLMRKGLAVALAGAVALGAAGCSGDKVGAKAPEVKPSTATESVAEPTETETPEDYTDQFIDDMESYKNMSVKEFETLPVEERLKYAQFLTDQIIERGIYDEFYQSKDTYIGSIDVNKDNTGNDIFNYFNKSLQITYLQYVEGNNPKPLDIEDGQKLLSAHFFDVTGETRTSGYTLNMYQQNKSFIASLVKPTAIENTVSFEREISDLSVGVYKDREFYYKDILTKDIDSGDDLYQRYVYCEFDSYDGSKRGAWLLESQELSMDYIHNMSVLDTTQNN